MKAVIVALLALVAIAFAGDECNSQKYSKDLTVRVALYDDQIDVSEVEVSQRFDLPTSASGEITVAINCMSFYLEGIDSNTCYRGDIVIRSFDPSADEPGVVLSRVPNVFCPFSAGWQTYSQSTRVTIPSKFPKSLCIGYSTPGTSSIYSMIFVSDQAVKPEAPNYFYSNSTNKWVKTSSYYGHFGINADIVVP